MYNREAMKQSYQDRTTDNQLCLSGIVERITHHNPETGWSVLKVSPFNEPLKVVAVIVHQVKVFAGSSMEFHGTWTHHPQHGDQFKAERAIEIKPATNSALERYLGSGLIKGVGPKTAHQIVEFFNERTLDVFENSTDELLQVPGIAERKLLHIKNSWQEHKAIRDVMIFLQEYGISTLYAVKIFKAYGNEAISIVSNNPYQLAKDIYGIGFFSADKVAQNMGYEKNGVPRIEAGIKHVLAESRDNGHCYLLEAQIIKDSQELLKAGTPQQITAILSSLIISGEIKKRVLLDENHQNVSAYYLNSVFFDEEYVAIKVKQFLIQTVLVDENHTKSWIEQYCVTQNVALSDEQKEFITSIAGLSFSILTGGPGVGKTTAIKVLVKLLEAMNKRVVLAAPTGRASQRMTEVIGLEAKTIHRLLEWSPVKNGFKKSEDDQLHADFLIIDECSMLDINLAAALMKAVPQNAQLLFIGDPDQLPSVGTGNVLYDLLQATCVPRFKLTKVFRQAQGNLIIRIAHEINQGHVPFIESPIQDFHIWKTKVECQFIDIEEASPEQLEFIAQARAAIKHTVTTGQEQIVKTGDTFTGIMKRYKDTVMIDNLFGQESNYGRDIQAPTFTIPEKFKHVDLLKLEQAKCAAAELKAIVKPLHPSSALHLGLTGLDVIQRLYTEKIPEYFGKDVEIQILSPQIKGSMGTLNLNNAIQNAVNPKQQWKKEIKIGECIYREGDRVIQTRNNYDLGVFNGDIGKIIAIDLESYSCLIQFGKQASIPYEREDLAEISLAYAITIHKSQGSEFDVLIIPIATQHFKMLFRNLIYTGLTRAKQLCVFVGSWQALSMAVKKIDNQRRQTALTHLIMS